MNTSKFAFLFLLICWGLGGYSSSFPPSGPKPTKPNVILIVGESHRHDALGIAGNPFIQTRNLDQLAKSGIQFKNAYVTTAICTVSRASILSGQHRLKHDINDFSTGFTDSAFNNTLPMVLGQNGYQLAWIGSYGVGKNPSISSFDLWDPNVPWMENGIHQTDNVALKANAWLENYDSASPFFMQLNFYSAHEIDPTADKPAHYLVQDRYKDLYNEVEIPFPASAEPRVWNSFPDFFRSDENIARKRWYGFFSNEELFQKSSKDYYRSLTGVDEAIGEIMIKLKKLGMDKNTIIIYTSDHGFSLGEHGIMGKWYPFQPSIRVPLIIYNPFDQETKGKQDGNSFALNIDIAPTILSMVGLSAPSAMQGVNLIDQFKGKIDKREQYFYEHSVIGSPGLPASEALVTKDYKYIKFTEHDFEILYDLKNDPQEIINEINNPKYKDVLSKLRAEFEKERKLSGELTVGLKHK